MLKPLWQTRPETANRLRGRCERVWDFAKARGHCSGENPFRWRGHLDKLLPKRARLTRGHHKAMPFADVPAFVGRLRAMQGVAPRALEFAILTAARSGEVLGARWDEIDLRAKVWTVPADRMKAGKEHRVPLSDRAMAILDELQPARVSDFVFPGFKRGCPAQQHGLGGSASPREAAMSRRTAFVHRSGTGPAIKRPLPVTLSRPHWRTRSRTRRRPPTAAAMHWKSAAS